ncbi:hypothetical protein QE430_001029 [Microbacterium testaceum]|uniref:hypothetical protein n=1 Tax=Microbacterium TaxID=33882 RepID=UPI002786FD2F|nr:hypothetical protein [Microbacterium testaceum]MDQ1172722.1 hypothetical protein [Microbacterium testaceum]
MDPKITGPIVVFGFVGALCAVVFFANLGNDSSPGVGVNRLLGLPTWAFGLLGVASAVLLIVLLIVQGRRDKS